MGVEVMGMEMKKAAETTTAAWLLKPPNAGLAAGEREWFAWAEAGAKDVLDDPNWLADNGDALTVAGQLEDMRYRLEEQAPDVAEMDATDAQRRGRRRSLNSLLCKLEQCGYWNECSH